MADFDAALAAHRAAIMEFLAATDRLGAAWSVPRAPGKWSPAQLTEHLAAGCEVSMGVVTGTSSAFPRLPGFARPLIRYLVFRKVLATGSFGRPVRTVKAMEPLRAAASPAEGRARLEQVVGTFESELKRWAGGADREIDHPVFGRMPVSDYVRFIEIHVRHHQKQLPGG